MVRWAHYTKLMREIRLSEVDARNRRSCAETVCIILERGARREQHDVTSTTYAAARYLVPNPL